MTLRLLTLCCLVALPSFSRGNEPNFDRTIAPLFITHCLDCHSGPKPKGRFDISRKQSAAAGIVPGKPQDSSVWQRVEAGEMPPKKKLSAEDQATLKAWIASGAKWGTDPIDPFRTTTANRAGFDWWSLQPLTKPAHNSIDAVIREKLKTHNLIPSPPADRRTLIRRLSFDLLGLPPTPEDVDAFVNATDEQAYERLVDRLLSSPHYGERWARHWLDVVRFGESNGFERDLPRTNAWPYRDWVIRALNADVPYDEFVRLQLAGDVLKPNDRQAIIATGFLVAGAHDTVMPVNKTMQQVMQQDELEDIIGTVGQTFLGLTVQCARCHDHKFDPISQKDYYQLAAALGGVQHGERNVQPADTTALARAAQQLREYHRELQTFEEPIRKRILGASAIEKTPTPLAEWDFTKSLMDLIGERHGRASGDVSVSTEGLRLNGESAYVLAPLKTRLQTKTLEAWVKLDNLTQRGGGVIGIQTRDGAVFDTIVFGEIAPKQWIAGSDFFRRTKSFAATPEPAETGATKDAVYLAITYSADGTITAYRNGQPYGTPYTTTLQTFDPADTEIVFGMRHSPLGGGKMLAGHIRRARLHDRALTADEVAATAKSTRFVTIREEDLARELSPNERATRHGIQAKIATVSAEIERLQSEDVTKVYAAVPRQPGKTHLLIRGEITQPSDEVMPAGLAALPGHDWHLRGDAPEAARRRKLAEWLTGPVQPLLARVIVNRLWHHHFGVGLVETPNDFGFSGGRPSHPELLDFLANKLIANGWKLKSLHKLIVSSATYQQSSRARPEAAAIDAGNRLLWRRSPQRLEAESVRDAMLAVSGTLDRSIGGRGYLDFKSYFFKGTQFYDPLPQTNATFYRRSIYRMHARSGRSPFLDAFDCPDPSTTTPRRAVTTTPLQALTLMNNAFVLHMADQFAERIKREPAPGIRAYRLAYGRAPTAAEHATAEEFIAKHGHAAFGRVLFNSSEFIYVD